MYQFFIINYNYDHIYKYIYINNSLFYKIEFYIYFSLFKILQLLLLNGSFDYLPKEEKKKKKIMIGKISRSALIQFLSSSKRTSFGI